MTTEITADQALRLIKTLKFLAALTTTDDPKWVPITSVWTQVHLLLGYGQIGRVSSLNDVGAYYATNYPTTILQLTKVCHAVDDVADHQPHLIVRVLAWVEANGGGSDRLKQALHHVLAGDLLMGMQWVSAASYYGKQKD